MERILLVEDDAQITASLSAFLQSEGFSVETATGETQARQLVEQTAPGLLLVDVQLAEGSGFGVCAYARSRGLPVIFLTASGDESRWRPSCASWPAGTALKWPCRNCCAGICATPTPPASPQRLSCWPRAGVTRPRPARR